MTVEMLFKRMWAPAPLACIPRHFGPCPSVPCSSRLLPHFSMHGFPSTFLPLQPFALFRQTHRAFLNLPHLSSRTLASFPTPLRRQRLGPHLQYRSSIFPQVPSLDAISFTTTTKHRQLERNARHDD